MDGPSFLNSGGTLASFHELGQTHFVKEKLKRSHKSWDRGIVGWLVVLGLTAL